MCVDRQKRSWEGRRRVNRISATVAYMQPRFFRDRPTYERILANARVAKNQFIDVFWYVVHT